METAYKTPRQLKIKQAEHDALVKVMKGLRNGRFKHLAHSALNHFEKKIEKPIFNMSETCAVRDCGTAACIGGWVYTVMKTGKVSPVALKNSDELRDAADTYVSHQNSRDSLNNLYYPPHLYETNESRGWGENDRVFVFEWDDITPAKAAKAIENFLTTGNPKWVETVYGITPISQR